MLLLLGGLTAKANLRDTGLFPEMGDLLRWGAFSLGGGVNETDTIDQFTGGAMRLALSRRSRMLSSPWRSQARRLSTGELSAAWSLESRTDGS